MEKRSRKIIPFFVLLLGILAISTASILIRFAQREVPSLVIAAYRLGIATLLLFPLGWKRKYTANLKGKDWVWLVLGGFFLACHFAAWITSLEHTTVASSVVLVTTTPLWVALLSPLVLHEKPGSSVWLGLIMAMVGSIWIGLQGNCAFEGMSISCLMGDSIQKRDYLVGNLLALSGALFASGYMLVGRYFRPRISLLPYITIVYGVAAVCLLGFVGIAHQRLWPYSGQALIILVALAIGPQILGHSAFNWALRFLPASFVTLGLLGEPVGTMILASLFLAELPTWGEIVGGGIILAGIYLASRSTLSTPN